MSEMASSQSQLQHEEDEKNKLKIPRNLNSAMIYVKAIAKPKIPVDDESPSSYTVAESI